MKNLLTQWETEEENRKIGGGVPLINRTPNGGVLFINKKLGGDVLNVHLSESSQNW